MKAMLRRVWKLHRHLRFSLGTLVLFVLLLGSLGGLWYRWEPWAVEHRFAIFEDQWPYALFSVDGKRILIADGDRLSVYATETGQQIFHVRTGLRSNATLGFLPDGERVMVCSREGNVQVWNILENRKLTEWRAHETKRMYWGLLTKDGSKLITTADDGTVSVWETATGRLLQTVRQGLCLPFQRCLDISDDRTKMAIQFGDEFILFDLESMRFYAIHELETAAKRVGIDFSPDGSSLLLGLSDGHYFVRAVDEKERYRLTDRTQLPDYSCEFSSDGRYVAVNPKGHPMRFWDVSGCAFAPNSLPAAPARRDIWFFDSHRMVTLTERELEENTFWRDMELWDVPSGRCLAKRGAPPFTAGMAWVVPEPKGHSFFFAGETAGLEILDARTLRTVFRFGDWHRLKDVHWASGAILTQHGDGGINLWRKRRDEGALGLLRCPELWMTILFAGLLAFRPASHLWRAYHARAKKRKATTG